VPAGGERGRVDAPESSELAPPGVASADDIARCLATLEALRARDPDDPDRVAVERAAAFLTKQAKQRRRLARKQANARRDREAMAGTGRAAAYFQRASEPATRELNNQRRCYICKQPFRRLHAFYAMLCPPCAERNFAARSASGAFAGRRAIVTGGRIKIGFEVARALARAGARVTITTRFPRDAARRYAEAGIECDVVGLDFLDVRGVMAWLDHELAKGEPLDILINNAAQTVRRPPAYYAALAAGEVGALPPPRDALATLLFPDRVDEEGQPLDLRHRNSWVLEATEVDPGELAEVHVVNAMVPFLLATRLRPLLVASRFPDRYIVNVSAMEGVFAYRNKQPRHPHTNMAKAALNMFTRTSAAEYLRDGIYMNSVDTGWITQENPHPTKQRIEAGGFCPPLDVVDGAARVIAPILRGVQGDRIAGVLFKDYEPAPW
jgi:NAD(P)-dependent dehydrogenase (short-subunit alcohol dehydrogenase family)